MKWKLEWDRESKTVGFVRTSSPREVARSIERYREALVSHPGDAAIHYLLGNCLLSQGNFDEARYHWKQALALDPDGANGRWAREELAEFGNE